MRRRSHYLELEEENLMHNTPYGPQVHPAGLGPAPYFSPLARVKSSGDPLDLGSPRSLSPTDPSSPLFSELYGFPTDGQTEAISPNPKASRYRQVSESPRMATTQR